MKIRQPSQRTSKSQTALRLFGRPCLAGLLLTGALARAATPADRAVEFRFPEGPADAGGNSITSTNTGPLSIGNHNPAAGGAVNTVMAGNPTGRNIGSDNGTMWRGLIDEIKIYNKVLTLAEIRAAQISPALPPYLLQENSLLSWDGVWQLQSRTDISAGSWSDVSTPTNVSGTVRSLTIPQINSAEFFRLRSQ